MEENKAKIGLVCIGLQGERLDLAESFLKEAKRELSKRNLYIISADIYTLQGDEVVWQTKHCVKEGADAIVYLIGTWILADHVINAVYALKTPFGIWGIPEPASFSSVGANVLHGSLGEMDISHELFYGNICDAEVLDEIENFAYAARTQKKLRKARMGLIGGRTISAYPTTADPNQIKKMFGVEVEHIDQLVLLKKAESVSGEAANALLETAEQQYGIIETSKERLKKALTIYIALKEIIKEYGLDMLSVKCIGEFMDEYCSACLALSMLNDEKFTATCQCNINATISSYILSQLSGNRCFFGDVNVVLKEDNTARIINCGSIPGKLAKTYQDIRLVTQYEYMGTGRGVCTLFCCKPGKVTFGTLGRVNGVYEMNIATGEAFEQPMEELKKVRNWAQGFIKLDCDSMKFYRNIRCNHSVMTYGIIEKQILHLCRMLDIKAVTYQHKR